MTRTSGLYLEVALPLRIFQTYTYSVPENLAQDVQVGARVIVPVRKQKHMGIILRIHSQRPDLARVLAILEILDTQPILTKQQLDLWHWMQEYYLATPYEILHTLLPAGLRLERRSMVLPSPVEDAPELNEPQATLLAYIRAKQHPYIDELEQKNWGRAIHRLLKELQELGLIEVQDRLTERVHPKYVRYVRLAESIANRNSVLETLEHLQKQKAQLRALMAIIALLQVKQLPLNEWLTTKSVQEKGEVTAATLATLEKKHILEITERAESRIPTFALEEEREFILTPEQQEAYNAIQHSMAQHLVTLLHGVTGSGKTEIYILLIRSVLAQGKQVLYLLPEIALTEYMIARIRVHFGAEVVVYHSQLSEAQRTELYMRLRNDPKSIKLILGVRSCLFLPFTNLGLVIVDEEHETSYKQQKPAPHYHGRDMAILLAQLHHAKVLLGSATPSIESYTHAKTGKYGYVHLAGRYGNAPMPIYECIDMKLAYQRKEFIQHFSDTLLTAIQKTVEKNEQVILFQNRRGYAPHTECPKCGWVARCPNCDVSLTYHRATEQLRCHYCGYSQAMLSCCPACASSEPRLTGLGTQRVEEELQEALPSLRLARLDTDSTQRKNAGQQILNNFAAGELDLLIGTQMVAKGLDFNSVTLVGILNADALLAYSDFRAHEHAFQLISQVGGRAGRRHTQGRVLIQTKYPELPIFQWIQNNNYDALYQKELAERQTTHYPPYVRLIRITLASKNEECVAQTTESLHEQLRSVLTCQILGPILPQITFIKSRFLREILLKLRRSDLTRNKQILYKVLTEFRIQHPEIAVTIDVDPYF